MISSASSPDRASRTETLLPTGPASPRPASQRPDQISTESAAYLRTALERHAAIRPEVVARAQALLADRNYPSAEIMTRIAQKIVATPDLTEDES